MVPREIITENSIFNKLKRKPEEQLTNKGINLELEIKMLRENQDSLMKICSQILSILQNK